jgi:hypothetical protein
MRARTHFLPSSGAVHLTRCLAACRTAQVTELCRELDMDRSELLTWFKRNNPNGVPQPPPAPVRRQRRLWRACACILPSCACLTRPSLASQRAPAPAPVAPAAPARRAAGASSSAGADARGSSSAFAPAGGAPLARAPRRNAAAPAPRAFGRADDDEADDEDAAPRRSSAAAPAPKPRLSKEAFHAKLPQGMPFWKAFTKSRMGRDQRDTLERVYADNRFPTARAPPPLLLLLRCVHACERANDETHGLTLCTHAVVL